MFNKLNRVIALTVFLAVSFIFSSCGVWKDFTTYFNTYYNAKTLFDQTEEDLLKKKTDIFAFRDDQPDNLQNNPYAMRPQYGQGQNMGNQYGNSQQFGNQQFGNQQFPNQQMGNQQYGNNQFGNNQYGNNQYGNNQYDNNSANRLANQSGILSSGNANQDLVKVIEKCSKILQFEKESSYFPSALFMTGKAFYYQQEYSKAQRKFSELAGLGETKYFLENKLWLAKSNLQLRSFDEGLKQIEEVKEQALKEDDEKLFTEASITKISFLIFRLEYTKAVTECKDFLASSDDDEMNALIAYQLGRIYQKLSDEQNALDAFESVSKYSPTFEIERKSRLEYARLLKQLNKIEESEALLEEMSNQGKYKNNLDEIYIELAQIYDQRNDLEKAIDYYKEVDSTFVTSPNSGIAAFKLAELYEKKIRDYDSSYKYYKRTTFSIAPREYQSESMNKTKNYDRYFELKKESRKLDKQLEYVTEPASFMRDSIDYDIAYKEYMAENKQQSNTMNQNQQTGSAMDLQIQQQQLAMQQQQQQSLQQMQLKLKNRKKNDIIPLKWLIIAGQAEKPLRPTSNEKDIRKTMATNYFNQGSLFFSELDFADSAYIYFKKTLQDTSQTPTRIKAIYSLATYYSTKKDSVTADSLYRFIYEKYPKDELAIASAEKLGLIEKKESKSQGFDPAESQYKKAEELFFAKEYQQSIDSFKVIYKKYPESQFAPKAIYFAGLIYEENLKNYDSAAVAYSLLADNFAANPIAKLPIAKYTEYKQEKDRIKREAEELKKKEEDKLKAEEEKKKLEEEKLKAEKEKAAQPEQKVISEIAKPDGSNPVQPENVVPDSLKKVKSDIPQNTGQDQKKDNTQKDTLKVPTKIPVK
jgi:tetratricopeptide (TPR) repeat protein